MRIKKRAGPKGQLAISLGIGGVALLVGIIMVFAGLSSKAEAQNFLDNGIALEGVVYHADKKVEKKRGRKGRTRTTYFLDCFAAPPGEQFDETDTNLQPWQARFTVDSDVYSKYSSANQTNYVPAEFLYLDSQNEWKLKEQVIEDKSDGGTMAIISPFIMLFGLAIAGIGIWRFKKHKGQPAPQMAGHHAGYTPQHYPTGMPVPPSPPQLHPQAMGQQQPMPPNPQAPQNNQWAGAPPTGHQPPVPPQPGAYPPQPGQQAYPPQQGQNLPPPKYPKR